MFDPCNVFTVRLHAWENVPDGSLPLTHIPVSNEGSSGESTKSPRPPSLAAAESKSPRGDSSPTSCDHLVFDYGGTFLNDVPFPMFLAGAWSALYGLRAMELAGMAHNDLKWENILFDRKVPRVVFVDFGLLADAANNRWWNRGSKYQWHPPDFNMARHTKDSVRRSAILGKGHGLAFAAWKALDPDLDFTKEGMEADVAAAEVDTSPMPRNVADTFTLGLTFLRYAVKAWDNGSADASTPKFMDFLAMVRHMTRANPRQRATPSATMHQYAAIVAVLPASPSPVYPAPPCADHMARQTEITPASRSTFISWLLDFLLVPSLSLHPSTIFHAANIMDRYCSLRPVKGHSIPALGCACLTIACTLREAAIPRFSGTMAVEACKRAFNVEQHRAMVMEVLATLRYSAYAPTVWTHLETLGAPPTVAARYNAVQSLRNYALLRYSYYAVAAACVKLSRETACERALRETISSPVMDGVMDVLNAL